MCFKTYDAFFISSLLYIILYQYPRNKTSMRILKYRLDLSVNFHGKFMFEV